MGTFFAGFGSFCGLVPGLAAGFHELFADGIFEGYFMAFDYFLGVY